MVAMLSNRVLRAVPRFVAPRIMATPTRAAMRPYSIAVAPDSSLAKAKIFCIFDSPKKDDTVILGLIGASVFAPPTWTNLVLKNYSQVKSVGLLTLT